MSLDQRKFHDFIYNAAGIWLVLGVSYGVRTSQQELKERWWDLVWTATGRGKLTGLLEEDRWSFLSRDMQSAMDIIFTIR